MFSGRVCYWHKYAYWHADMRNSMTWRHFLILSSFAHQDQGISRLAMSLSHIFEFELYVEFVRLLHAQHRTLPLFFWREGHGVPFIYTVNGVLCTN